MSFSRISYDTCSYAQELNQNVSYLSYTLDTVKYQHCSPCRAEMMVGGNNVSKIDGNLVDLESNLFGIDREASQCSAFKYLPGEAVGKKQFKTTCYKPLPVQPTKHLKTCQFYPIQSTLNAPQMDLFKCGK